MDRPDVQGRVRILKVHSRGKQIGKDVDFEKIARRTPGTASVMAAACLMHVPMLHQSALVCLHVCVSHVTT